MILFRLPEADSPGALRRSRPLGVAFRCEDAIIVRKTERFVKIKRIEGDLSRLRVGGILK